MNNQKSINNSQLRLLLPSDWIDELDTIAREHFKTRLALLRQYIREKMDEDLSELDQIIARREQIRNAKSHVDGWFLKEMKRKEDDKW